MTAIRALARWYFWHESPAFPLPARLAPWLFGFAHNLGRPHRVDDEEEER